MTIRRATYVEDAYAAIRSAIVGGKLSPGQQVVVRPLTEELGLSPTPIKGALAALEREGFLVAIPHRGYFVPAVSATDMREIYELREVLDGIAARRSAAVEAHARLAAQLGELLAGQRARVADGDLAGYSDLDVAFHRPIPEDGAAPACRHQGVPLRRHQPQPGRGDHVVLASVEKVLRKVRSCVVIQTLSRGKHLSSPPAVSPYRRLPWERIGGGRHGRLRLSSHITQTRRAVRS